MQIERTRLPEVVRIVPRVFEDARGYFFESWHEREFAAAGIEVHFVQDNHSHSVRHTLRGLHYQLHFPQGKLVRVTRGEVLDVAVDIRRGSPRFGQWTAARLTERNHQMLWVPPGFAHGYVALSDEVDVLYKCTEYYQPKDERAILWSDAQLGIDWELPAGSAPILSPKDAAAPALVAAELPAWLPSA